MPKRRRKLSKEFEKLIALAKKDIELITAKIHDIEEDEILDEYKTAFTPVLKCYMIIDHSYKEVGYNEDIENFYKDYLYQMQKFTGEYEI